VLDRAEPWYEVLIVDEPVQHPNTGAILVPAGTQVLGRFENNAANGQRFISQVIVQGGDRDPVVATSDTLAGRPRGVPTC
jgi:c-di-GMP-binding flagellar brake protein YcgR